MKNSKFRYDNDALFPATPGPKRALHKAVGILESLGHRMVKVDPEEGPHSAYRLLMQLFGPGAEWRDELLRDSPTDREGRGIGKSN